MFNKQKHEIIDRIDEIERFLRERIDRVHDLVQNICPHDEGFKYYDRRYGATGACFTFGVGPMLCEDQAFKKCNKCGKEINISQEEYKEGKKTETDSWVDKQIALKMKEIDKLKAEKALNNSK